MQFVPRPYTAWVKAGRLSERSLTVAADLSSGTPDGTVANLGENSSFDFRFMSLRSVVRPRPGLSWTSPVLRTKGLSNTDFVAVDPAPSG